MEKNFYSYGIQRWICFEEREVTSKWVRNVAIVGGIVSLSFLLLYVSIRVSRFSFLCFCVIEVIILLWAAGCRFMAFPFKLKSLRNMVGFKIGVPSIILLIIFAFFCDSIEQGLFLVLFAVVFISVTVIAIHLVKSNIEELTQQTRELWLAEDGMGGWTQTKWRENQVFMRRIGNWADFIHCGQSCAFAWILGSFYVHVYCVHYGVTCPYGYLNIGLLLSMLILFLELFAEWHRCHHILHVLNNK